MVRDGPRNERKGTGACLGSGTIWQPKTTLGLVMNRITDCIGEAWRRGSSVVRESWHG